MKVRIPAGVIDKVCKCSGRFLFGSIILPIILSLLDGFIFQQMSILRIRIYLLLFISLAVLFSIIKLYCVSKTNQIRKTWVVAMIILLSMLMIVIFLFNSICYLLYDAGNVTDENASFYCELAEMKHSPSRNAVDTYYTDYVDDIYDLDFLALSEEKIFETLNKCDMLIRNEYIAKHLVKSREKLLQIKIDLEKVYVLDDALIEDFEDYSDNQLLIAAEEAFISGEYSESIEMYKYLILCGTISDSKHRSIPYNNIGYIYSELQNNKLAKYYYYRAHDLGSEIAMGNLVMIYNDSLMSSEEFVEVLESACLSNDARIERYLYTLYQKCGYELASDSVDYISDFLNRADSEKVGILSSTPRKHYYVTRTSSYLPSGAILISIDWVASDDVGYSVYTYKAEVEVVDVDIDFSSEALFDYIH